MNLAQVLKSDPAARGVLEARYLRLGETPEGLLRRVATAVSDGEEETAAQFHEMMLNLDFLPNSPTLMNAGRAFGQLAACFVIPVEDTLEDIFEAVKTMAIVQKSGGGTGFSFSRLRPKGDPVDSTNGVASGPVSFMRVFNAATEEIKQGGTRRGANMAVLRVDHPDILEFISCKQVEGQLANFNISVGITDAFMAAVQCDADFTLKWKGKGYNMLRASWILNTLAERAWRNGEPGVVFLDTINANNPTPEQGCLEATNPCGEQPLLANECCTLGSINLANMVHVPTFTEISDSLLAQSHCDAAPHIDMDRLVRTVKLAVIFLDNVLSVNAFPTPEMRDITYANRKIGLGVMGWADLLIALEIPYDSEQALLVAREVMQTIQRTALEASEVLGRRKGSYLSRCPPSAGGTGQASLRNATRTTIAPTGSLSMIAGVSSGIEPIFALAFTKRVLGGQEFWYMNKAFEQEVVPTLSQGELNQVLSTGSCQEITRLPEKVRALFKTASEITPEWHIRMQAAFQEFTDNAVSKTINLPPSATVADVKAAIIQAHQLKCKGLTLYRRGSRREEVLLVPGERDGSPTGSTQQPDGLRLEGRPASVGGTTTRVSTGCGKMYITVNSQEGRTFEAFITMGASGGCRAFGEAVGRLISLALRAGIPRGLIVDQLTSVVCPNYMGRKAQSKLRGKSCPDIIGRVLAEAGEASDHGKVHYSKAHYDKLLGHLPSEHPREPICPLCGCLLLATEGCFTCLSCGWSKCS